MVDPQRAPKRFLKCPRPKTIWNHFSICACHPCAGAMLIFSVSFQVYQMSPKTRKNGYCVRTYYDVFGTVKRDGGVVGKTNIKLAPLSNVTVANAITH